MNTSEYISSGILESYALGLCSPAEAADVEHMCSLHPEVQAELDEIRSSLEAYAQSHSAAPAADLKTRIFDEIDTLDREEKHDLMQDAQPKIISISRYLAAAAIVVFGLSLAGNIVFYNRWKSANDALITLNNEKNVLAQQLKTNQVKLQNMDNEMAVMGNPEMTRVMMKGLPKSPQSLAVIYWHKASSQVYIHVKNLPQPTEGRQYQLWAIVDGKPVDAGMLPVEGLTGLMMKMKNFPSAQAFAITLEKSGGSPSPTLGEMIVMGAI